MMKSVGIFPSYHWGLEQANWKGRMEKSQLLLVSSSGCPWLQPSSQPRVLALPGAAPALQGSRQVLPLPSLAFFSSFCINGARTQWNPKLCLGQVFWSYSKLLLGHWQSADHILCESETTYTWKSHVRIGIQVRSCFHQFWFRDLR